jgi:hypothetical protein
MCSSKRAIGVTWSEVVGLPRVIEPRAFATDVALISVLSNYSGSHLVVTCILACCGFSGSALYLCCIIPNLLVSFTA